MHLLQIEDWRVENSRSILALLEVIQLLHVLYAYGHITSPQKKTQKLNQ